MPTIDAVFAHAPSVAIVQIRRQSLTGNGFSEMALYTLIERDGPWCLAQNIPITGPARPAQQPQPSGAGEEIN